MNGDIRSAARTLCSELVLLLNVDDRSVMRCYI